MAKELRTQLRKTMAMVYCRACAKELHETALTCPQCGASQQAFVPPTQAAIPWLAIVSLILGIICALTLFDDSEWDTETILGVGLFCIAGLACGIICINQKHPGRNLAIAGIILSGLTVVVLSCLSIE
jgi:peptidoglycan/LPS O-acetylase OafA/YrhL